MHKFKIQTIIDSMNSKPEFSNSLNFSLNNILGNKSTSDSKIVPKSDRVDSAVGMIDKYIRFILHGYFFLLPALFIPFVYDQFTFGRFLLTILVSSLLTILLGIKFYLKGTVDVSFSKVTIYLILFSLSLFASYYFSTDRYSAVFGNAGNYYSAGLFYMGVMLIAFFATMQKVGFATLRKSFIAGILLSTLTAYVSLLKVNVPYFGDLASQFNLSGTVVMLLGLQIFAAVISMISLIEMPKMNALKAFYAIVFVLSSSYILIVLDITAVVILLIALFVVMSVYGKKFNENRTLIGMLVGIILAVLVINNTSARDILRMDRVAVQPRMGLIDSWLVSASTAKEFPLFGTGLGTFSTFYSIYRPAFVNTTPNAGLRFMYPMNDLFLVLSTMGYVGLIVFVVMLIAVIKKSVELVHKGEHVEESIALLLSLLLLLVLGINPILLVATFFLIGMQIKNTGAVKTFSNKALGAVLSLPGFAFLIGSVIFLRGVAMGEYYYYKALTTPLSESYVYLNRAIISAPFEDVYRRTLVLNNLAISAQASRRENLSDAEKQNIVDLLSQARANAEFLVQKSPASVANWEVLGTFYKGLVGAVDNADVAASQAYQNALRYEPTNPALYLSLGSIYYGQKQYQLAVNSFAQAVALKNDYANAYYNLAYALKDGGNIEQALIQLQIVDRLTPTGTEDSKKVREDLATFTKLYEEYRAKVAAAIAAQQAQQGVQAPVEKPNTATLKPAPQPEPLRTPAEQTSTKIETNEKLELNENASPTTTETKKLPAADGTNVNAEQGQIDAPLAKPAQ